jgi:hypothetical protein
LTTFAWEIVAEDSSAGVDSGVRECGISEVMRLGFDVNGVRTRRLGVGVARVGRRVRV